MQGLIWLILIFFISQTYVAESGKLLGFRDPNTNYLYTLNSLNATTFGTGSPYRSLIKVSRVKLDERKRPVGRPEPIQTLKFTPPLVDFDLQCSPKHCYLVTVTSRTKRNVELFSWQRTQFDSSAVRDSFARAQAVKIIAINSGFYIVVAQEQLHLSPYRYSLATSDDEEPTRFMGCAVLKFIKGHEHNVKYHQFIRLPFNPRHVNHFTTINSNNVTDSIVGPTENHHLVFSADSNWADPETPDSVRSFIWSPLNDYFWSYRMPRGAEAAQSKPGTQVLNFAEPPPPPQSLPLVLNSTNQRPQQDYAGAVETCFYQLQRVLADRDLEARRLIESSRSVWRAPSEGNQYQQAAAASLTNISAQVVVHGNVIVSGTIIDNPQITIIGKNQPMRRAEQPPAPTTPMLHVVHLVNSHSPAIVDNKFKQALFKLNYIREKLSRAVRADLDVGWPQGATFFNQIRFFGRLLADEVMFNGIANSDVRLNDIPFKQLQNELVSLNGAQNIGGKIEFHGRVVADRLEIHGLINDNFYLKDAIDILSDRIQIIETTGQDNFVQLPGLAPVEFKSISAPNVILAHNASVNSIRLSEFITRDNRTQVIVGRKTFRRLSMSKLDLEHHAVLLNGVNISHIARNAIRLRPEQPYQTIPGNHGATFMKPIFVNKLTFNSKINQHINITSLIHDSIKTNSYEVQQIFGQKNFLNGLKVKRLNTEGALNGIEVSQVFNLNPAPPIPEQHLDTNFTASSSHQYDVPIMGEFVFRAPVQVAGSVHANLVNGIDLTRRAIRRVPANLVQLNGNRSQLASPQIVRGHKTFFMPLRVINDIRLIDSRRASQLINNSTRIPYPLINGIDMRMVSAGLARLMQKPPPIFVENLNIHGNLDIPTQVDKNGSSSILFGNYSVCPLELIRSRVVLASAEDQFIDTPLRINSLRAKSISVGPNALNEFDFPSDFVLRTAVSSASLTPPIVEPIYGIKTIEHLVVSPAMLPSGMNLGPASGPLVQQGVVLERGASINQVPYSELQTFIAHERNLNSTGEKIFNTMHVYGNIFSKRINGYYWPDDILLRSVSSTPGTPTLPFIHKRIYSHLIFTNSSSLRVENQLVLRGPIQLNGRMNGVNLTEFSRQSATYGDKDLLSNGRPIRNKIFLGGLSVRNEIRSEGLIDGVNVEEMKHRVVTIGPPGRPVHITSPKIFTDVSFDGPVRMMYLNGVSVDSYLNRIRFEPDGITLRVRNKKTITGALRINKNLYVHGLVNGIDFTNLKARPISLGPTEELVFNKSLVVEGDVFMDNLLISERNGTIDGVKLRNLVQIGPHAKDEFTIVNPRVSRMAGPYGRSMKINGSIMECQIGCEVQPVIQQLHNRTSTSRSLSYQPQTSRPVVVPSQSVMSFTSRPVLFNQGNYAITRTTPPYTLASSYQPPLMPTPRPSMQAARPMHPPQRLVNRKPYSIRYEPRQAVPAKRYVAPDRASIIAEQLETLRKRIVSINLVRLSRDSNLVVGFIDAPTNDVSSYMLPENEPSHYDHLVSHQRSYLQLDQIDFKFRPTTTYHLSVGVATNRYGQNLTSVSSSLGGNNLRELSVLPVESPNGAMFIRIPNVQALFLLISQDRSTSSEMCPATGMILPTDRYMDGTQYYDGPSRADNGVHVYLFHALQNSSSLTSAYFDLYQTIDLLGVDSFQKFSYGDSTYVLAISRELNRIYLLLLRGYTGFQVVSHIDAPMIESVSIMYSIDKKPVLVVHQTSGIHRIMEAVVI
uniref:Uncharacterized protein n=1 Tax=Aceria tosichella TaxID=561515 RepID=A0A6G1SJW0_9ACAR